MTIQLKIGQVWKTRHGETVTITGYVGEHNYPWKCDNGESYVGDGSFWGFARKDRRDLVTLILDAPVPHTTPTLIDIFARLVTLRSQVNETVIAISRMLTGETKEDADVIRRASELLGDK